MKNIKIVILTLALSSILSLTAIGNQKSNTIKPIEMAADNIVWGSSVRGLKAAVELIPEKDCYNFGEKIDIQFKIKNISDKVIVLPSTNWRFGEESKCMITDNDGKTIPVSQAWFSGWSVIKRYNILPYETITIKAASLMLFNDESVPDANDLVGYQASVEPGNYSINFELLFPDIFRKDANGVQTVPLPSDWQGALITGSRKICVNFKTNQRVVQDKWIDWTRILPDGSKLKLIAVFEPGEKNRKFWTPDGYLIKEHSHLNQFHNGIGELGVVLERDTTKKDAAGNTISGSISRFRYIWSKFDKSEPTSLSFAKSYGQWEDMGVINENQDLGNYHITKVKSRVSGKTKQIRATMYWKFNPDFTVRLVAVNKNGEEFEMSSGDPFFGNYEKGKQITYSANAIGLTKEEINHFKLQRRPLAWVEFNGFAVVSVENTKQAKYNFEDSLLYNSIWDFALYFDWDDIAALLECAQSSQILETYPSNPISSYAQKNVIKGMIALWYIEAIRLKYEYIALKGINSPKETDLIRFIGLNPVCTKGKDTFPSEDTKSSLEIHLKVLNAYQQWWSKVKDMDNLKAAQINPLDGTGLYWYGWRNWIIQDVED